MPDISQSSAPKQPAEPPAGGRQDHDAMQAAAMRPITGPASTDTLAAIGGGDLPGREAHPELSEQSQHSAAETATTTFRRHEPIPGERDVTTLTHREPGAVGSGFAGANVPSPDPHAWMDDRTAAEHSKEGGGS